MSIGSVTRVDPNGLMTGIGLDGVAAANKCAVKYTTVAGTKREQAKPIVSADRGNRLGLRNDIYMT